MTDLSTAPQTASPDTLKLLSTRRSVKPIEMVSPGPSADQIDTLLRIASRVPDHGKLAPWRFIVFEGDARARVSESLAAIFQKNRPDATPDQVAMERQRFLRAPLVIGVVSRAAPHAKIPEWEQLLSAGASCMNLLTAAHAMGFAASWLTEWYAYDRAALDLFGLAAHERMAGFVYFGTAKKPPEDRDRPKLSDIVTRYGA